MELNVLMGHAPAKVDDKGRLKIPSGFRKLIEEKYGSECFITSVDGECAVVYPLAVWYEVHSRLARMAYTAVSKGKYLERANYYGQVSPIDAQGRVLVPAVLRQVAEVVDDVVVLGSNDHLVIWNEAKIQRRLAERPLTAEDYKELELNGV